MINSIIRRVPLFSNLPPAEIEALAATLTEKTYPAQTVLFREDERGDRFYIVVEGVIEIIKAMDTPDERILEIRDMGEFIGEMSLLSRDGLRTASARVQTHSRLLELARADFESLLSREPTIVYEMLRALSERLGVAQDKALQELIEKNRQLTRAYEELKAAQAQIIEKEILDRELHQANEIQQSMLPSALPQITGYDIGALMIPAREVGGDFYDAFPLGDDYLGLVVGDVSGKGIPAALYMAMTTRLLRAEAGNGISPETTLQCVNAHLLDMNIKQMFVTILYGILEKSTGKFTYVRAGHEYPLVCDPVGKVLPVEKSRGLPLGLFDQPLLEVLSTHMLPGCTLVIYSDGITEAENDREEFFGTTGLEAVLPGLLAESAQGLCDRLVESIAKFSGDVPQSDDITVLILKKLL
jgi:sigma-B regulation protein RsbU (phosphoserine phosphatase)